MFVIEERVIYVIGLLYWSYILIDILLFFWCILVGFILIFFDKIILEIDK